MAAAAIGNPRCRNPGWKPPWKLLTAKEPLRNAPAPIAAGRKPPPPMAAARKPPPPIPSQQPRQMLFSLRSIVLFSSLIAASVFVCGADPVVMPGAVFVPEDCAVPAVLVPGGGGEPTALPGPAEAPLAALPALCANETTGDARIAIAVIAADALFIANL